jgi:hypothetical protein
VTCTEVSIVHTHPSRSTKYRRARSDVLDDDRAARDGRLRGGRAALVDHVDRVRARRRHAPRALARRRARERDSAEVRHRHQRRALLEVLDDPLRVLLAQRGSGRDRLGHALARRVVLDHGRARLGRRRSDGDGDRVAGGEGDAGEVVGVVGVPLVPS